MPTRPVPTIAQPDYEAPTTAPLVVTLTNPEDLYVALQQAAQQLMGGDDTNQANVDAFVASYHAQETAFQKRQTNVEPATPLAAAEAWISEYFQIPIEAYQFAQAGSAIDCMIQSGHPGPCPVTTTTWP